MFLLRWALDFVALDARESSGVGSPRVRAILRADLDAICRTARRLGVPAADIEDVVQDVMLVVIQRVDSIAADKERAFVVGTTIRVVANWRRRQRRREQPSECVEALLGEIEARTSAARLAAIGALEQTEHLALLEAALAQMTHAQREAFVLFELEELTAKQVAEQLAVSEGTVAARVRRAREVLWRVCEERGYPSGGAETGTAR